MLFQHFRFSATPSPHIYPSHLPYEIFRTLISLACNHFHEFAEKVLSAQVGSTVLNSKTGIIGSKKQGFFDVETAEVSSIGRRLSAQSLCCSFVALFFGHMLDHSRGTILLWRVRIVFRHRHGRRFHCSNCLCSPPQKRRRADGVKSNWELMIPI